ncbi:succinate dehydrogenase cytochrome b560 subunit [Artomyces pyxidatus]|uniref:Succinate dehydrogenase cytochrome b560 subunit n=1 Tax=Artomyces pyxidatus TaxID=48021 RepID=A0ACB8T8W7_9AGAM|nr:succinate dehydrogenase cytochrome b560 subunit [Artomyces pyxidatus]
MNYTRAVGLSSALRHAAFAPKLSRNQAVLRSVLFKRTVKTQSLPPSAADEILNTQRLKRPSSPHFTIYQPQLTWIASIANRVTGVGLSVLLYGFSLAYLVAPSTFSSANVVETVKGLPTSVKVAGKTILAAPFAFHSLNGLRHLAWDTGKFLSLSGVYRTGYAVLGASAVATVALVLL